MRFSSVVLFQGLGPLALHSYWLKSSVDRHLSCSRLAAWAETEVNNKITITIVVCLVMGLHLLFTLTLSVILMSTCFANINLSKSWGRKERSLPFAYSRLLWRCVIQTYCDVISEMLVARISVIFTSRGLRNRPWFRLRVRVFYLNAGYRILVHLLISLPLIHKQWNLPFVARIGIFFTLTCRNQWGYQKQPNNKTAKHLSPASDMYSAALYRHRVNIVPASELSARCFPKVQSLITN
jgi:hypothetical protein